MKTARGGGLEAEGELIEVVEVPRSQAKKFALDESIPKSSTLVFGFLLFLAGSELFDDSS